MAGGAIGVTTRCGLRLDDMAGPCCKASAGRVETTPRSADAWQFESLKTLDQIVSAVEICVLHCELRNTGGDLC